MSLTINAFPVGICRFQNAEAVPGVASGQLLCGRVVLFLTRGGFQPTGTLNLSLPAAGGEARSVEGQVQQLLHDAQDPEKLSRMYVGWASWV